MMEAYQRARRKINDRGLRAKKTYDRWVRSSVLEPGDRVPARNLSERGGTGKLRSFWEDDIHVVIKQKGPESPVYEIKPENGGGRTGFYTAINCSLVTTYPQTQINQPRKYHLEPYRSVRNSANLACHTLMTHPATMKMPKQS